ncbi:unnamed protein product [Acanthosepion pharaonis]|uniref:Uncharacterized protein n=1 Tax=Acanthosepion pharaonis TaxID=158019 RepID=A0A812EBC4_ACAPH|nr:unnamed protein product [Sepia pharaonis]
MLILSSPVRSLSYAYRYQNTFSRPTSPSAYSPRLYCCHAIITIASNIRIAKLIPTANNEPSLTIFDVGGIKKGVPSLQTRLNSYPQQHTHRFLFSFPFFSLVINVDYSSIFFESLFGLLSISLSLSLSLSLSTIAKLNLFISITFSFFFNLF